MFERALRKVKIRPNECVAQEVIPNKKLAQESHLMNTIFKNNLKTFFY